MRRTALQLNSSTDTDYPRQVTASGYYLLMIPSIQLGSCRSVLVSADSEGSEEPCHTKHPKHQALIYNYQLLKSSKIPSNSTLEPRYEYQVHTWISVVIHNMDTNQLLTLYIIGLNHDFVMIIALAAYDFFIDTYIR
jgi:hypothetical protein